MSGGVQKLAETTHYWFGVRYTSHNGIKYQGLRVYRKRTKEEDKWERSEEIYLDEWSEQDPRLFDAFDELEKEHGAVHAFAQLTKEQVTLADIWNRLRNAEREVRIYRERAESAERIINELNRYRYEQEERVAKEREKE